MKSNEIDLQDLVNKFYEFRSNRPTPKARIPAELWDKAYELAKVISYSRVGKACGLNPSHLKHYRPKEAQTTPQVRIAPVGSAANNFSFGSSSCRVVVKSGKSELFIDSCSEVSLANIVRAFMESNQ